MPSPVDDTIVACCVVYKLFLAVNVVAVLGIDFDFPVAVGRFDLVY